MSAGASERLHVSYQPLAVGAVEKTAARLCETPESHRFAVEWVPVAELAGGPTVCVIARPQ